jgi:glucose/arabinose dehydrogenase
MAAAFVAAVLLRRSRSTSASLLALAFSAPLSAQVERSAEISVPPGFQVALFHEGVGPARHIAVRGNGDVYVSTREEPKKGTRSTGSIIALRDRDGDGKADMVERFGDVKGTGIRFHAGKLYASDPGSVHRFSFVGNELVPSRRETILSGMPPTNFSSRALAFDSAGNIYVGIGGAGNVCTTGSGPGAKGADPCPDLATRAGIWRYRADRIGQSHPGDGRRVATGIRDLLAMDWDSRGKSLIVALQGRNGMNSAWPKLFTAEDNAHGIAEEVHRVRPGAHLGWPYTYYDPRLRRRMVAPEYGGGGKTPAPAGIYAEPLLTLPPHSSPLHLLIYSHTAFPARYRGGMFVALHGGFNRAPLRQQGYQVVFIPKRLEGPEEYQVFADGFAGGEEKRTPRDAVYRPSGLAIAPDGALYVVDSKKGRIWRITYRAANRPNR